MQFARIAPAGFRLLGAIEHAARACGVSLTITSGTDNHGPTDPHTKGEAYDIRSRGMPREQQTQVLTAIMMYLSDGADDAPSATSGGLATHAFFGFLENPGTAQEHFHVQRRKGRLYP